MYMSEESFDERNSLEYWLMVFELLFGCQYYRFANEVKESKESLSTLSHLIKCRRKIEWKNFLINIVCLLLVILLPGNLRMTSGYSPYSQCSI